MYVLYYTTAYTLGAMALVVCHYYYYVYTEHIVPMLYYYNYYYLDTNIDKPAGFTLHRFVHSVVYYIS